MTPEDIDRWNPAQIGEVFRVCQARQEACSTTSEQLRSPELFETWGGTAGKAADEAAGKKRADIDAHGNEVAAVAEAASVAQAEVEAVKRQLEEVRAFAAAKGLVIDDASGNVELPSWEISTMNVDRANDRDTAQVMLNRVMLAADDADRDLAMAIQVAVGQLPSRASSGVSLGLPPAETLDHLPGREFETAPGVTTVGPTAKTSSTRVLPVQVPRGWSDPDMSSDLARMYAKEITLDPNAPGATGGASGNLLGRNRITDQGVGVPGIGEDRRVLPNKAGRPETGGGRAGGSLDLDATENQRVRVVGAQPSHVGSVEVDGISYLTVTYDYEFEVDKVRTYGVNGIQVPDSNSANWQSISGAEAAGLANRGVPLPDPGANR
ncbi:hypothetical protein V1Y59_13740 [Gordonia sp. PKS22-38]|uniref:Uncharacterized protein n=1 Tax=Gordonia prachuapensis TaxID=3115651 RepID=A0ABU7MV17_9ACTN|nr:hypothetical protein [Gordonia sp. PKS22-38]